MKRQFGTIFTVLALATILVIPLRADASSAEGAYQIATRIVEQSPSVGEFDGSLQLKISPDGIVSGYYRPEDNARFISVAGGVTGDRFWLEIGSFSTQPWRFSGTFRTGEIDASSNGFLLDDGRITALKLIGTVKTSER